MTTTKFEKLLVAGGRLALNSNLIFNKLTEIGIMTSWLLDLEEATIKKDKQ